MLVATALLVYVLWLVIAAAIVSFSAAGIGAALSPLALSVFALWGPLALTAVIFVCMWFDPPTEKRSNRVVWELVPYVLAAVAEIAAALVYILPTGHGARPPSADMVLAWIMVLAAKSAHAALMCVTHDAFRTEEMAIKVPRVVVVFERSKHV